MRKRTKGWLARKEEIGGGRGHYYAALQYGMPFGCIAAVVAFHRFGNLLEHVLRHMLKAPNGRYVDDFFGASRKGVQHHGGYCLTQLCLWIGIM